MESGLKEPQQISVFCTLVIPYTAGFVKALSTPLVESKRKLCYAHVTVSRFYRTTACISDLETNELIVSPSTHFPRSGVHLKSFKSPSISWYLETVSPQKVRKGEQTEVARTVVC